jgi:hypothetical protein
MEVPDSTLGSAKHDLVVGYSIRSFRICCVSNMKH